MKELIITIDSTSGKTKTTIDAKGFVGKECLKATAGLEAALGGEVTDRDMKPEANRFNNTQQQQVSGS